MTQIRKRAIEGLKTGDLFTVSRTFSEQDVINFAKISRDYNPVHCDERFTKIKNFDGLICHGLLVASLITEIGGQIGWLASSMSLEFKKPVYIDESVTCDLTIIEIDKRGRAKAEAVITNRNKIIVLEASLNGIVPGQPEKTVLKEMVDEGVPTNKITP